MQQPIDGIYLAMGYSPIYDADTPYREFFTFLFGEFTSIRFNVEEFAPKIRRVSVLHINSRLAGAKEIDERYTGASGRPHHTANGALMCFEFDAICPSTTLKRQVTQAYESVSPPKLATAAE